MADEPTITTEQLLASLQAWINADNAPEDQKADAIAKARSLSPKLWPVVITAHIRVSAEG